MFFLSLHNTLVFAVNYLRSPSSNSVSSKPSSWDCFAIEDINMDKCSSGGRAGRPTTEWLSFQIPLHPGLCRCVLGQVTLTPMPCMPVSEGGGVIGADCQPQFCQSAPGPQHQCGMNEEWFSMWVLWVPWKASYTSGPLLLLFCYCKSSVQTFLSWCGCSYFAD